MAYTSGTITDANPGPQLANVFQTAMSGVGWTFVEDVVISTITYRIMKSPAASNSFGADFYVAISFTTTGTGTLSYRLFEVWDSTNKKMIRYAPSSSTAATPGTTAGAYLYAVNDTVGVTLNTVSNLTASAFTTSQPFAYYLSTTADRIIFGGRNGSTDSGAYIGLFDSFLTTT